MVTSLRMAWQGPPRLMLMYAMLLLLARGVRAAETPHLSVADLRAEGSTIERGAGEIRMDRPGTLLVTLECAPAHPGLQYRYRAVDTGLWSAPDLSPTQSVPIPSSGTWRILFTAASPADGFASDTLALVVHLEGRRSWSASPISPRIRLSPDQLLFPVIGAIVVLAVIAGVLGSRRRSRRNVMKSPGSSFEPADPPTGPAGESPSAPRESAEVMDLRSELALARQEVGELKGRLRETNRGTQELARLNQELEERCSFLEKSNVELQELHRRKDEILAGIAHDIKNPAGAIQLLAEILQSYDLTAQEQHQFVADIIQTSARVLQLSQDLSMLLVMEVRTLPLVLSIAPIGPVVERVCRTNQIQAKKKSIAIRCHLPATPIEAEVDVKRMEEALDNLIGNAIKYSNPETVVQVEVRATSSHLSIDVIDQGIGLSEEDIQQAFQIGRTLSARPTAGESSTGMGLWVVRKIADAHHGGVTVQSATDKGSTFTIRIPLRQPAGDSQA